MSTITVKDGTTILRLFPAAGRDVRALVERPTPAAEVGAMPETVDTQPGDGGSFNVANRDHDADRLDAAAGCEYVDDRIRLPE